MTAYPPPWTSALTKAHEMARACEVSLLYVAGVAFELLSIASFVLVINVLGLFVLSSEPMGKRISEMFECLGYFATLGMVVLSVLINLTCRGACLTVML